MSAVGRPADEPDSEPRHEVECPRCVATIRARMADASHEVQAREVVDLRAEQADYQEIVRKLRGENDTAWGRVHDLRRENFQLRSEAAALRDPAQIVKASYDYPPAIDESDMERARRIAARAEDLPEFNDVTCSLIEALYEEVMRLRPNAAAMRVTGNALASAAEWVAVAGEPRDWRALNARVADWRSVADPADADGSDRA